MSNNDKKLDVISGIDEKIIDKCTKKKVELLAKLRIRTKRLTAMLVSASILCASFLSVFIFVWYKQVPVYTGMSLSKSNPVQNRADIGDDVVLLSTDDMRDTLYGMGYGEGHLLLDKDKDKDKDKYDPNAQGANDIFYCKPNEDFYITVHIDNPKNYEILSFTLNGKKYSSYMFEEGSDMENLVLKCNVGQDAYGIIEYTIDAIKYVDGTSIKDVRLKGDKTVRIGVYNAFGQPSATIENVKKDYTSIKADITLEDEHNALSYGKYELYAELAVNGKKVAEKRLSLGVNRNVLFEGIADGTAYDIQVVGYYDNFDGSGYSRHVLERKSNIMTESALTLEISDTAFDSVSYSVIKDKGFESLEIRKAYVTLDDAARTLVDNTIVNGQTISGLYSNHNYYLCVEYTVNGVDVIKEIGFKTVKRSDPVIDLKNVKYGPTSISFELSTKNTDGTICEIKAVNIYDGDKLVATLPSSEKYTFKDLKPIETYTVRVEYTVDKKDGEKPYTDSVEFSAVTQSEGLEIKDGKVVGIGSCKDSIVYVNMPVEEEAFKYCNNLQVVVLGSNVVGYVSFKNCYNIRYVFCHSGCWPYGISDLKIIEAADLEDGKEYREDYSRGDNDYSPRYFVNSEWIQKTFTRDKNGYVTTVLNDGRKALVAYFGSSKNIVIPNGVNVIMPGVFYEMEIESVKMPSSLTEIGIAAFSRCENLTDIDWSPSLTRIGVGAFLGCPLKRIVIPDGVTELENSVFCECYEVTEIVLSKNLKAIRRGALYLDYDGEKMMILPSTLEIIEAYGIKLADNGSVFVPKSVKILDEGAIVGGNIYFEIAKMPDNWHPNAIEGAKSVVWGYKLK